MNIKDLRMKLGDTQSEFAKRYGIPFRTVQNWEAGIRKPPAYVWNMLKHCVSDDLINRKTVALPKKDSAKADLPRRSNYITAIAWLKDVKNVLGDSVIFALDEALMCQGNFGGRNDEYIVWVYGDDSLQKYNGVVVIGNEICTHDITERNGLLYTKFNRTLCDAFANESILDMQGTTEALSKYYYTNNESFEGVSVAPEYQHRFEKLANEAIYYYDN